MWNKVYLALLVIGVLIGGFFIYYASSWLQSIGDPRSAWEAYNYHRRAGVYFMVSWTVILIAVANVVLWTQRNAWALWTSHAYFVVFALLLLVVLHLLGINFCLENRVCEDPSKVIGVLLAVLGSFLLGAFVFVDQYVVLRMQERMYARRGEAGVGLEKENSRDLDPES